jgi:AraC-like DNA-binding protein
MQEILEGLRRLVRGAAGPQMETAIPRVAMVRGEVPEHHLAGVYEPMINLVLQGGKTLTIGDQALYYGPASYFVMSIDVPATGVVHHDGPDKPYVSVALTLDVEVLAAMMTELPTVQPDRGPRGGFSVCPLTPSLLDAWARLLRLMETPEDVPILAPLYEREVLYRVLQGPQGWLLRALATPDSALAQVRRSIRWMRTHYSESMRIEDLAVLAGMSASAFHRHFKAATGMSPLQFQKTIRLLQARTLLVAGSATAAGAAYDVGYESPSQFSREYARFFGLPPARDMVRIKHQIGA